MDVHIVGCGKICKWVRACIRSYGVIGGRERDVGEDSEGGDRPSVSIVLLTLPDREGTSVLPGP